MGSEGEKRILVVDDEPVICRTLHDLLLLDGHSVHTANSPGDTIELCRMRHFDLVFLDYYLPEMSGEKLLAIIKRNNPKQRVIVMSGQKPFPRLPTADYQMKKPFTAQQIRDLIARYA